MKQPCKVWPLRSGVKGFNATHNPVQLQPGVPGWMEYSDAVGAERRGEVDIMVGKTPQTLRQPVYDTREVVAEKAPSHGLEVPTGAEDPNNVIDEDQSDTAPPKRPSAGKARVTKKRLYRRTDLRAEE